MSRILILVSLIFLVACGDDAGGASPPPPPPKVKHDAGPDCRPEKDEELCELHGAECGEITVVDDCGDERIIDCGEEAEVCEGPDTCGGGGEPNRCGCGNETAEELCAQHEAECGELKIVDSCGIDRTVNCGESEEVCEAPDVCGGGGEPNRCGCTADESDEALCALNDAECGILTVPDSCGIQRTVNCGDSEAVCEGLDTCGGGGEPNRCGCTPDFIDERTDEEICEAEQAECGVLQIADSCGVTRPVHCDDGEDPCEGPNRCGGGGEPNVCGCTPEESDEELCELHGAECGDLEITDSCGVKRTINCDDPEMPCVLPTSCGGGGEANRCGCTADEDPLIYCAEIDATCGVILATNRCGDLQYVNCGDEAEVCEPHETCGGAGEEHACGCTPTTCELSNYVCGIFDNGCAGELECETFCVEGVRAGAEHACMFGSARMRCWGRGQNGRLGVGGTTNQRNPQWVRYVGDSVELIGVVDVGVGAAHTCAVLDDGRAICWGDNARGQLGNGTTEEVRGPDLTKAVYFQKPGPVEKIGGGVEHSCAIVGGAVFCWGSNSYGQIGDGGLDYGAHSTVPQPVFGLEEDVIDLAVGAYHSCALKGDGTVHCWGRNHRGQLGNLVEQTEVHLRETGACGFQPVDAAVGVRGSGSEALDIHTRHETDHSKPVEVMGLPSDIVQIAAGEGFSCALSAGEGELYCWGAMTQSRTYAPGASACGDVEGKAPIDCAIWPPPAFADHEDVFPITRQQDNVCCKSGDDEICRDNVLQDVFLNRAAIRPIPIQAGVASLAAGNQHLCFIVDAPSDGATNVYCMGANTHGQLGDGTNNNWGKPTPITPIHDSTTRLVADKLSLGRLYSCAYVDEPPSVYCWGDNAVGQIGNDAFDLNKQSHQPYPVRLDYMAITE